MISKLSYRAIVAAGRIRGNTVFVLRVNHHPAGEVSARQVTCDFLAVAVLASRIGRIQEAQIVIEENQIELLGRQDLDSGRGRRREAHPRQSFPEPGEAILGVVENEDAPVSGNMEVH